MKKYKDYRWKHYNFKKKVKSGWKPKQNGALTIKTYTSHSYENKQFTTLGHLSQTIKSKEFTDG